MTQALPIAAPEAIVPQRILIADPDAVTRQLYHESLRTMPCDILDAVDGRDALVKALTRVPSLVITELRLPFINGYELCDILRHDRVTADVPILVATKDAGPAEVARAIKAGADFVLDKATAIETLLSKMQHLLWHSMELRAHSDAVRNRFRQQITESEVLLARSAHHRKTSSKVHPRFTTTSPPTSPPELTCPD